MAEPAAPSFGTRAAAAIAEHGPLCVGIDAHPSLLEAWGLPQTPAGLLRFSMGVVEALEGRVAAIKPQVAWYEAYGSSGMGVLEQTLEACRQAGILSIADAKRGDIGSTMQAYARTWLAEESALRADAVTLSPYLGAGALEPAFELAEATGRGTFVLALTSNPEGTSVQHRGAPESVAAAVAEAVSQRNSGALSASVQVTPGEDSHYDRFVTGPHGLVVGATTGEAIAQVGVDLAGLDGLVLAPGYGAQGATAQHLGAMFSQVRGRVLVNSSRGILAAGPEPQALQGAVSAAQAELSPELSAA
ncbi:orotidine-5'-phosphate decarboxylase [Kocuria palustris]|uniref:orotidine-5'-phosphate decarboxylase n=1 Tax=Kocuria palustris TaxID=71999 RepID=UPI00364A224B